MNNIFTVYYLLNNVWTDITSLCDLPFLDKTALDETLDQASLNLTFTSISEPFVPFTKFKIVIQDTVNEKTETLYKVLDRDIVTRETFGEYSHALYLIEPTKVLERVVLGGKAFTNRLSLKITPLYEQTDGVDEPFRSKYGELILETYGQPLVLDSNLLIHTPRDLATISVFAVGQYVPDPVIITVKKPDGTTVSVSGGDNFVIDQLSSDYSDNPYEIIYTLNYTFGSIFGGISYGQEVWSYSAISQSEEDIASQRLTVSKIIRRLLKSKQTLKVDNTNEIVEYGVANTVSKMSQQFYFDNEWFEKFDKVLAPEILIPSKSTLWEALVQVLNNVQALPRLTANLLDDKKFDRIVCDEIGKKEEFTGTIEVTAETNDYASDMYATSLDMVAENILNTNDTEQGSIVEPYKTGYKTTRAEDTRIVIKDDSAIITVDRPIYRVVKVEMGFINNTNKVEDITRYVYEKTEYDKLTSVDKIYPASKAYALYYEMGGTQIQGLSFKNEPDALNLVVSGLVTPAIENIVKYVFPSATMPDYKNLGFRITYIPEDTMRIESLHPEFLFLVNTGSEAASSLIENQTENIVDSEEVGNKLKGIISRLSNPQKTITTFVDSEEELPKIGMKYGEFYVTTVTREIHDNYIQATIGLTKNFNRISEYVGLESERRFYQVSERQSLERMINIPLVVTVGRADFNYVPEITNVGINCIRDLFVGDFNYSQATALISTTKEEYVAEVSKEIAKTIHSVSSLSSGNSLVFNFKYKDNFSAGFKSLDYSTGARATQEYVPYGNEYGNFKLLDISISESINEQDTYEKQRDFGKAYPGLPTGYTITPVNNYLNLTDYWVDKDSREQLNTTIQVHFVANERNLIVGNGLAKFNNMVFNGQRQLIMVLLDKEISVIDKFIDIENQVVIEMPTIDTLSGIGPYRRFRIESTTVPLVENEPTFKAWAIIDNQTNELIIGRNEEITADGTESTTAVYFNF